MENKFYARKLRFNRISIYSALRFAATIDMYLDSIVKENPKLIVNNANVESSNQVVITYRSRNKNLFEILDKRIYINFKEMDRIFFEAEYPVLRNKRLKKRVRN